MVRRLSEWKIEVEHLWVSCIPDIVVPPSTCSQKLSEMPSRRASRVRRIVGISKAERRVDADVDVGIRVLAVEKAKRRVIDVPVTIISGISIAPLYK
jgi:hypothetical protein